MKGIDYGWGRPLAKNIAAKGYQFVCRYLSANPTKNITSAEIQDFHSHNLKICLVWQTTEKRPLSGFEGGKSDARRARNLASTLGFPSYRPIYFACDYDFSPKDQPLIDEYFKGIATIIPVCLIGIYGGYYVVKRVVDAKLATFIWQTSAWSGGKWDSRAHLRQVRYDERINGVQCDINLAMQEDFGQW